MYAVYNLAHDSFSKKMENIQVTGALAIKGLFTAFCVCVCLNLNSHVHRSIVFYAKVK